MSKASFIKDKFGQFRDDTRGAVAIIYALTLIMVFMIARLAIDTARGMRAGNSISTASTPRSLPASKACGCTT